LTESNSCRILPAPMPLITLTSDFGEEDYLAGAAKGILLNTIPQTQLVDISHRLLPFSDHKTAYVVSHAVRYYPENSYHLILCNLYYHLPEYVLFVYHNKQYYLLADNGLITMILDTSPEEVVKLSLDNIRQQNLIYLIEVFADAIKKHVAGEKLSAIGQPIDTVKSRNVLQPIRTDEYIDGQILYIDAYENVIVNITKDQFETARKGRNFRIRYSRNDSIVRISETYADVTPGEKLALFNAAGYLEIAVNRGNAAGLFGLSDYSEQNKSKYSQARISYQTVRVIFED
jgi:S-adenosylmethionine hydrolase